MASVCRICLTGNMTLYALKNDPLLIIYKKLTTTKYHFSSHYNALEMDMFSTFKAFEFNSEDSRPKAVCCFCYQKLLKCHTFSQMALRSEKIYTDMYDKGVEVTHEYIAEVNLNMKQHLSVIAIQPFTVNGNVGNSDLQVTVKDEPLPSTHIKQEVTSKPGILVEVGSSLEDCTQTQLIFKEDNNDLIKIYDVDGHIFDINVEQTRPDDSNMAFSCNNCNKIFYVKSKLISHIRNSHSQVKRKLYSSTNKHTETGAVETIKNLKNHITCHECDRNFVSKNVLLHHIITNHTGKKSFACNECEKQFRKKDSLVVHMRTHKGEKSFACNLCVKQFDSKSSLVSHMKTHKGEKSFACNLCVKQFDSESSLVSHMRTHTGEKSFACNLCDKQFDSKSFLVSHMRTHTGEKSFACNLCDKQFDSKSSLVSHMRTHTVEKSFACNLCVKQFDRKSYLVSHMKAHTDKKSFACNLCVKQFSHKCRLISHMRTHTGEKPFACNECDKKFDRKPTLVRHRITHTGDKPFACNVCDKAFRQKNTLLRHKITHTDKKSFTCHICGKKFFLSYGLVRHMRIHGTGNSQFIPT